MLKHEEIEDGNLVFDSGENTYHIITEVGNAVEKGDRNGSSLTDKELSYGITDVITDKTQSGICEHSGMTSQTLRLASREEVNLYLKRIQADIQYKQAKIGKKLVRVQSAINRFNTRYAN